MEKYIGKKVSRAVDNSFEKIEQITFHLQNCHDSAAKRSEGKLNLQDEKAADTRILLAQILLDITERKGLLNDGISTQVRSSTLQNNSEQDERGLRH